MRPNIQISHQLNGRVKDYAAENDLTVDEAYKEIIERGLDIQEEKVAIADGGFTRAFGAIAEGEDWDPFDCSFCGERIETREELYEHARECANWDV